jgi:hypothetical protein
MAENANRLERLPGVRWAMQHPRLAAWIVLSVGMVALLVIEARDVGLLPTQWAALVAACVLVAGACVWIISWEDPDETEQPAAPAAAAATPPPTDSEE